MSELATDHDAPPPGLLPHHWEELRRSGLTATTVQAAGIHSETQYRRLASLLGWHKLPKKMAPALVFPFHGEDGSNGYARIKPDVPRKKGRDVVKYESPRGRANEVYLPPGIASVLTDAGRTLLITEGEKKALKAMQEGFACLGLVGVYGWKDGRSERLLPALELVTWQGRQVYLVFDSDVAENVQVQDAEARLAVHLARRGATVKVVRLPAGEGGAKVGLDDFLVASGPEALHRLLADAEEPTDVEAVEMRAQAKEIEPFTEVRAYLATHEADGVSRLRTWRGAFYMWSAGRYVERQTGEVRARLVRHLNRTYSHLTTSIIGNLMMQLQSQPLIVADHEPPAWIERAPVDWPPDEMLAASNGLVHLPSLVTSREHFLAPTPRFFTTTALEFPFDAQAPRPDGWLAFLAQLWPDDPTAIELLQDWFGYCLTPDTRQQKILLLVGPKRSGKGTLARVLRALVGPGNVAGPTLASLGTNFGLWPILGKTLAIVADARLGGRSDQAAVVERLLSISGEDALTVDRKMLEPVTCKLSARLMIVSNELPHLADSSGALTSRMLLLQLRESFYGREDQGLTPRLLKELPGILLWAIQGWHRLRERGYFVQPASARELLGEMEDLASPIAAFVREVCQVGDMDEVGRADLYAAYGLWCHVNGKRPEDAARFGRGLRAAVDGVRDAQVRQGEAGKPLRLYRGLGLTPAAVESLRRRAAAAQQAQHVAQESTRGARGIEYG